MSPEQAEFGAAVKDAALKWDTLTTAREANAGQTHGSQDKTLAYRFAGPPGVGEMIMARRQLNRLRAIAEGRLDSRNAPGVQMEPLLPPGRWFSLPDNAVGLPIVTRNKPLPPNFFGVDAVVKQFVLFIDEKAAKEGNRDSTPPTTDTSNQ